MFRFSLFILTVLASGFPSIAEACNRCGSFNRCAFVQQKAVVVQTQQAPAVIQGPDVYVIQNNNPSPLVAQGTTSYSTSYSQAVLPLVDPNAYFASQMQLIQAVNSTNASATERVSALFERTLEIQAPAVERLATGQAAQMVLQAAGFDSHSESYASQAVVINRDRNGVLQVVPLSQDQIESVTSSYSREEKRSTRAGSARYPALQKYCGSCHGTQLASPDAGFYLGEGAQVAEAMRAEFFKIDQYVKGGAMPPASHPQQPDENARLDIMDEISSIINNR